MLNNPENTAMNFAGIPSRKFDSIYILLVISEYDEYGEICLHDIVIKAMDMGILTLFMCVRYKESHAIINVKADSMVMLIYDRDYVKVYYEAYKAMRSFLLQYDLCQQ